MLSSSERQKYKTMLTSCDAMPESSSFKALLDQYPGYRKSMSRRLTRPRRSQDQDEMKTYLLQAPPRQDEHEISISAWWTRSAPHGTAHPGRKEGRTDGIPCAPAPAPARGVRRSREWAKRSSKEKKQKHRRRRETRSGPGPWHSTPNPNPNPNPTSTPAPAKFKLGKQPVWTAYASPNVAERGRKELQNNARTTGVQYKYNQRERRVVEEPRGQWKRKRGQGFRRVEGIKDWWSAIKESSRQCKRAMGSVTYAILPAIDVRWATSSFTSTMYEDEEGGGVGGEEAREEKWRGRQRSGDAWTRAGQSSQPNWSTEVVHWAPLQTDGSDGQARAFFKRVDMVFIAPKSEDAGRNVGALGVVGSAVSMMAVWKNLRCTATARRSASQSSHGCHRRQSPLLKRPPAFYSKPNTPLLLYRSAAVEVPYGSHVAIGPSGHSVIPAILIT
ncbi:hypothetical protein B0H13DRAFT_2576807 [Mycena leptocephala]|nr:hypothetical protein B0H13DRAFT_2576807 [Mycena leptocephala]